MVAICFIAYAANHPEEFFPWPISITYIIYRLYLIVMICMFLTAMVLKIKKEISTSNRSFLSTFCFHSQRFWCILFLAETIEDTVELAIHLNLRRKTAQERGAEKQRRKEVDYHGKNSQLYY